ncbi:hypothetical protein HELRODRAFT_177669 [Helobdella robusta]|uniref:Uncharacterized protein n=1 Tax=Helobdella robusta TaxID=6412 RepID=T1FC16_HELRO|nr:hypothetical protein HELRODRAFT_177669 [Helobdella robusta]ESN97996.1 hypothetical protein HELRODRAFT_177669 [Helobdella robusta]
MAFESYGLENIKIHVPEGGFFGQLNKLLGIGCSSEQSSGMRNKFTTETWDNGTQVDKSTKSFKLEPLVRNVNYNINAQRALEEEYPIFKEHGILKMKRTKKTYFPSLIIK